MALSSTIYRFTVDLSDVDQGVYETFEFQAAKHPSESTPYFVTRLLAYALHRHQGVVFSRGGLSDPSGPPLLVADLTGKMTCWIDIGHPSPERLHKATKGAEHVWVYTYKNPQLLVDAVAKSTVHRAADIICLALDRAFIDPLGEALERKSRWSIVRTEGELFVETPHGSFSGRLHPHALG